MVDLNAGPNDAIEHAAVIYRRTPRGLFSNIGLMAVHSCSLNSQRMMRGSGFEA
jgi:hypothetical protein